MPPETREGPATFNLVSIVITKAAYELIHADGIKTGTRPPKMQVNVEMIAKVNLLSMETAKGPGHGAFVALDCKIKPDLEWQPYRIEVNIAGAFQTTNGTADELMNFAQKAAPSILFPYIRETAHRLTMDAPMGVVRLDPMNISTLLNQNPWSDGNPSATEPQPPSSQSASASPE